MISGRLLLTALLLASLSTNAILAGAIRYGITTRASASALVREIRNTIGVREGLASDPKRSGITCWGDSLTAGTGAGLHEDYCSVLAALLYRSSYNGGVGGETSSQIRKRMLERPAGLDSGTTIIWAGRNNYKEMQEVVDDVSAMVTSLPSQAHFLVLGILRGEYPDERPGEPGDTKISQLNRELARVYSGKFVDIQQQFPVTKAMRYQADQIHLNRLGYSKVALTVAQTILDQSW
ncbi:lysophospholipase L1-like esterase [Bradyrhizobium sp. GM7.3]